MPAQQGARLRNVREYETLSTSSFPQLHQIDAATLRITWRATRSKQTDVNRQCALAPIRTRSKKARTLRSARLTHFADNTDDNTQHLGRLRIDRLHRSVRRLQADAIGFGVPILERGFAVVGDRNDDIAFVSGASAAAYDDVAVGDLSFNHRV